MNMKGDDEDMGEMNRRTVVRTAAWVTPAVIVAAATPAFANSREVDCRPKGCKYPGQSHKNRSWTYDLEVGCNDGRTASSVIIDNQVATPVGNGTFRIQRRNSKSTLPVLINFTDGTTWTGTVKFLPCKKGKC